ncbi:MAG: PDGLE domain-containing protein [bacterium]
MKNKIWLFILIGLAVSLFLAVFVSHRASTLPDGLEWVAEIKGFLHLGERWTAWKWSPVPDYIFPGIKNETIATALAGLIGTLAVFGIGCLIAKIASKRSGTGVGDRE